MNDVKPPPYCERLHESAVSAKIVGKMIWFWYENNWVMHIVKGVSDSGRTIYIDFPPTNCCISVRSRDLWIVPEQEATWLEPTPAETHNMSSFQQTALIKGLADMYGFDAADAMTHFKGVNASDVEKLASATADPAHIKPAGIKASAGENKIIVSAEGGNEPPLGNALNGIVAEELFNEDLDAELNMHSIAAILSEQDTTRNRKRKVVSTEDFTYDDRDSGNE